LVEATALLTYLDRSMAYGFFFENLPDTVL
jgi:hypothetical protein